MNGRQAAVLITGIVLATIGLFVGLQTHGPGGYMCGSAFAPQDMSVLSNECSEQLQSPRVLALVLIASGILTAVSGIACFRTPVRLRPRKEDDWKPFKADLSDL